MTFPPYEPTPTQQLTGDLMGLTEEWEKLGIDPDDFLRCSACHGWIFPQDDEPEKTCTCPDD